MFGMVNAPSDYQKTLVQILLGLDGVFNMLDDILVSGRTKEIHDRRLEQVLKRLEEYNFKLNESKCVYGVNELEFLGWHISSKGIQPTGDKMEAISLFREPQNVDEVRSFLGLVNFVGNCIPDLSTKSFALRKLLKKDEKFEWGPDQQRAFATLKASLSDKSILGFFNPQDDVILMVDASPVGLGAVLAQRNQQWKYKVIAFASKSLSDVERKYCQTEREALGIVFGCERFQFYLFGREFFLYTDCKPLQFLFSKRSKPCARIERWVLRVQSFSFKVCYKPGKENIADCLSRLVEGMKIPMDSTCEGSLLQLAELSRPIAISLEEIKSHSIQDKEILAVKSALKTNLWDGLAEDFKLFANELCEVEDMLLRGTRLVMPSELRARTLSLAHEGHPGIKNMKIRLREKVWWPSIDKDAERKVKACQECLLVSLPNRPEPMNPSRFPNGAWEAVALDFKGPLPSGEYLLVVIDYFSKFIQVEVLSSISAQQLIKAMRSIFTNFGPPYSIRADNGSQINCEEFREFCREYDIKLIHTPPYWPQANGEVERMNQTIGKQLKISRSRKSDWKEDLKIFISNYHATPQSTTGISPAELMLNRKIRNKLPSMSLTQVENESLADRIKIRSADMKEYTDRKRRAKDSKIQEGDEVLLYDTAKKSKLDTNFKPERYKVLRKEKGEVTVQSKEDGSVKKRNVVHVKKVINQEQPNLQNESSEKNQHHQLDPEERIREPPPPTSQPETEQFQKSSKRPAAQSLIGERPKRLKVAPAYLGDYVNHTHEV